MRSCNGSSMRATHALLAPALAAGALMLAPASAHADVDSLVTVGVGAQYAYVSAKSIAGDQAPERQYGFVSRLKVLRFLGAEATTNFDEDPHTQRDRILSPRYQVGAMLNLIPTEDFNLFLVGGTGAQRASDLFNAKGATTSFHAGPGLEIFIGSHVAVGGDFRFRMPGPSFIKEEVQDQISTQQALMATGGTPAKTIDANVGPRTWQANFTLSFYL